MQTYGIKVDAKSWHEHKPNRVTENEQVTIFWDSQIKKDTLNLHNKPDLVIKEKETDMCLIIDVAISSDYNIQKKATEKMKRCRSLDRMSKNVG